MKEKKEGYIPVKEEWDALKELAEFSINLAEKYNLSIYQMIGLLVTLAFDMVYTWNEMVEITHLERIEKLKKMEEEKKFGVGE